MPITLDLADELDRARLGSRRWALVVVLGLIVFFDGYDVFAPAYVIPYAMKLWHLKPSQAGLLVSSGLVGFMIGALTNGLIADRIGRKPTLLGALAVSGVLTLATALFARSFAGFLLLRGLTGVGLGMLLPLSVAMVNETAPRRAANLLVGVMMAGWSIGGVVAPLVGATLARSHGWPSLFWAGGLTLPLVIAGAALMTESPRFLAEAGRTEQARAAMAWLLPERAEAYRTAVFAAPSVKASRGSLARLLAPGLRRATLVLWLCSACSLFAIYGLSGWVPQAMIQKGEGFGASFAFGALLQTMAVVGGLAVGWAADRVAPRTVLAATWALGAVAIAGLGLLNLHWTNIACVALAGFAMMGAQPVLNNLAASLYPTEIRSTGIGAELGVGRLGGILGPYVGGWLQQAFAGSAALFTAMAAAVALSAVVLPLCLGPRRTPQ